MSEPCLVEVSVQANVGGKVAIRDYGKVTSNWGYSLSRKFEIPEDWTEEQAEEFQLAQRAHLVEILEPFDQAAYDERIEQADWT